MVDYDDYIDYSKHYKNYDAMRAMKKECGDEVSLSTRLPMCIILGDTEEFLELVTGNKMSSKVLANLISLAIGFRNVQCATVTFDIYRKRVPKAKRLGICNRWMSYALELQDVALFTMLQHGRVDLPVNAWVHALGTPATNLKFLEHLLTLKTLPDLQA